MDILILFFLDKYVYINSNMTGFADLDSFGILFPVKEFPVSTGSARIQATRGSLGKLTFY
jgi:hypothetical protein